MFEAMTNVVVAGSNLNAQEKNLLVQSFKCVISKRRMSLKMLYMLKSKE
jgi:hypothetical protein